MVESCQPTLWYEWLRKVIMTGGTSQRARGSGKDAPAWPAARDSYERHYFDSIIPTCSFNLKIFNTRMEILHMKQCYLPV